MIAAIVQSGGHSSKEGPEKDENKHDHRSNRSNREGDRDHHQSIDQEGANADGKKRNEDHGGHRDRTTGRASEISEQSVSLIRTRKKEPFEWFVGTTAFVPRKVIVKSCSILDEKDSRDKPGMMYEETLKAMVKRFDKVFNYGVDSSEKVNSVITHLEKHTLRRRGKQVLGEGFNKVIEWEQTSRIYELFSIELNVFERIFYTVDVGESTAVVPKMISFFLISMIFISIITWMIGTIPACQRVPDKDPSSDTSCNGNTKAGECAPEPLPVFKIIEKVCVITFTIEYLVRLFTAHSVRKAFQNEKILEAVLIGNSRPLMRRSMSHVSQMSLESANTGPTQSSYPEKLDGKVMSTIRHVTAFANVIDLLAILPFWLQTFEIQGGGGFLVVLRVLRLTRIFRIFKVGKYNDMFTLFSRVVNSSVEALGLMIFFIILGCCLFGTLIWFAEQGKWYPEGNPTLADMGVVGRGAYLRHTGSKSDDDLQESPFQSIIHSAWYVVVTISTVGYGDFFPTTPVGQVIGAVTILTGIIVLAMPIGVVGANFSKEYYDLIEDKKRRKRMQQQLAAQEQVEEEQDAALDRMTAGDGMDDALKNEEDHVGDEIAKVDRKREELLREAAKIDKTWERDLSETAYRDLSEHLRYFVVSFVDAEAVAQVTSRVGMSQPRVHLSQLWELDDITASVYKAISATTSEDEAAEFRLEEAHRMREEWSKFTENCWEYAMKFCRVEKRPSAPEYYTMLANIASRPTRWSRSSRTFDNLGQQDTIKSQATFDHIMKSSPGTHREEMKSVDTYSDLYPPQAVKAVEALPPENAPHTLDVGGNTKQPENGATLLPGAVANSSQNADVCKNHTTG